MEKAPHEMQDEWRAAKDEFSEHKLKLIDKETKKRMLEELWNDRVDIDPEEAKQAEGNQGRAAPPVASRGSRHSSRAASPVATRGSRPPSRAVSPVATRGSRPSSRVQSPASVASRAKRARGADDAIDLEPTAPSLVRGGGEEAKQQKIYAWDRCS